MAPVKEIHYDIKKLPPWSKLNDKVRLIEQNSSWMERYGMDWLHVLGIAALVPAALQLLKSESFAALGLALFILGCFHAVLAFKSAHLSAHNAMCDSKLWGSFWTTFFVEFIGSYSSYMGINAHIKNHHPHTNIIGLGDSSVWKVPQLSRMPYMFGAPLLFPVLTPAIALSQLVELGAWSKIPKYLVVMGSGLAVHVWTLVSVSGYSVSGALLVIFVYRAVLVIPYIHVNIFQHIGLPMYSQDHRPARIYQMSSGVLNLHSHRLLNFAFGHSLISCHVEHHLFPRLSDNMCKKVRPVVREYLLENGLPYNEDSYSNRLKIFLKEYETLMVNAPPITHFIGIQ